MHCFKTHTLGLMLLLVGLGGCQSGGGNARWDWWRGTQKSDPPPNSALAGSPYDGVELPSTLAAPKSLTKSKTKTESPARSSLTGVPPGTPTSDPYASTASATKPYPATSYPSTAYPSTAYPSTAYPSTAYPSTAYPSQPANLAQQRPAAGPGNSLPALKNPYPSSSPASLSGTPGAVTPYGSPASGAAAVPPRYPSTTAAVGSQPPFGRPPNSNVVAGTPTASTRNGPLGPRYATLPNWPSGTHFDARSANPPQKTPLAPPVATLSPVYPVVGATATTGVPATGRPAQPPLGNSYPVPRYRSPTGPVPPTQTPSASYPLAAPESAATAIPFRPGSTSTYAPDSKPTGAAFPASPSANFPATNTPYNPPAVSTRYGEAASGQ
jgi:hypothetical protein